MSLSGGAQEAGGTLKEGHLGLLTQIEVLSPTLGQLDESISFSFLSLTASLSPISVSLLCLPPLPSSHSSSHQSTTELGRPWAPSHV